MICPVCDEGELRDEQETTYEEREFKPSYEELEERLAITAGLLLVARTVISPDHLLKRQIDHFLETGKRL